MGGSPQLYCCLAGPGTMVGQPALGSGGWAVSGKPGWRMGPKMRNRSRDSEAPLHQTPDVALPNGSVHFMHCQGHGCEKHGCGGFTER